MASRPALGVLSAFDNTRSSSGSGNTHSGAGFSRNEELASVLFLLASDVLAGVGLRSALRTFLRSHVPLIEFSTGVNVNIQQLEQNITRPITLSLPQDVPQQTPANTAFIVKVKGLKNRGQTCYANSVMQALASLQPLYTYLDSLQKNSNGSRESISLALFQTLQHINGHQATRKRITRSSFLPFSLFSSSSPGDPLKVMDIVAQHHSQFRSRNSMGMAGMQEQQDSHEFFSALMDVLSSEEEGGGSKVNTNTVNYTSKGLACCNSFAHSDESGGGLSDVCFDAECKDKRGDAMVEPESSLNNISNTFADEGEEEKKHEEHNSHDTASGQVSNQNQSEGSQLAQHKKVPPSSPTAKELQHTPITNPETLSTQNPFDGWSGSTIKCATCCHIRPIRSTPFLGLSLPIAIIRSEYLEDFLAAEYGGFARSERVSDVQCFSCAIGNKIQELEGEELLLSGAISSIQRRSKGQKIMTQNGNGRKTDGQESDIVGLLQESQNCRRKIAILNALDPDADDDKLECRDKEDTQQEIELGINNSLPPIVPLRGDAYKASLVMRPPEVLCIHIQRRHYDMSCHRMVKVSRHVHFDEELDLGAYCAYGENSFEKQRILAAPASNSARIPYKLMSVIEHMGNAFGGHYQTYRRVDPELNQWVLVSDECISTRTWNDVRSCQAYMLFYAKN